MRTGVIAPQKPSDRRALCATAHKKLGIIIIPEDRALIKLLYISYVVFFGLLLLTNEFFLGYCEFIYVTVPLALLPVKIDGTQKWGGFTLPRCYISFSNPIQTISATRSWVFLWTMIFGATLVLVSSFTPNFSSAWLSALVGYLFAIAIFTLVTARLAIHIDDFFGAFFTIFSTIVSVNALINIYDYCQSLSGIMGFVDVRLSPTFGHVPVHFPTVGAMTYATGLAAAGGLFAFENCKIRKSIAAGCGIILFVAICLTQSRGPLFASMITLAFIFFMSSRGPWRPFFLAAPLFLVLLFLLIPKVGALAVERGDNHRLEVWRRFIDLAARRPIIGYGERLEVHLEISDGQVLGHAHNLFLSAFMRGGIFGLVSLMGAYLTSFVNGARYAAQFNNPIPMGVVLVTVIAGLVDFDQIIFLADWQWVSFWLPLGLAVSVEQKFWIEKLTLRNVLKFRQWEIC